MSKPAELCIRPAKAEDYAAIASIYNEAIAEGGITMDAHPKTAEDIQAIAEKMGSREIYLVGETAQGVAGWGIVKAYSDRLGYQVACETSIYLSFAAIGKGYGRALQAALMQKVSDYKYHHVVAKILGGNTSSIKFHQQFGFEIVGVQNQIGLINGTWHDVVILQHILPPDQTQISQP